MALNTMALNMGTVQRRAPGRLGDNSLPAHNVNTADHQYRITAAGVNLGISLLESRIGHWALHTIGDSLVQDNPDGTLYDIDKLHLMGDFAREFLGKLRAQFCPIVLSPNMKIEGQFDKADWRWQGDSRVPLRTLEEYSTTDAGTLTLNAMMIDNIVYAAEMLNNPRTGGDYANLCQEAYENGMFTLGVTVAHELVHMWVGCLTGSPLPNTPPHISYLPDHYRSQNPNDGESGREWEHIVFGATVESFYDENNMMGDYQGGDVYTLNPQRQYTRVERASIQALTRFAFNDIEVRDPRTQVPYLLLRTDGNAMTVREAELRQGFYHMEVIRGAIIQDRERQAQAASSSRERPSASRSTSAASSSSRSSRPRTAAVVRFRGDDFRNLRRIAYDPRRLISRA